MEGMMLFCVSGIQVFFEIHTRKKKGMDENFLNMRLTKMKLKEEKMKT